MKTPSREFYFAITCFLLGILFLILSSFLSLVISAIILKGYAFFLFVPLFLLSIYLSAKFSYQLTKTNLNITDRNKVSRILLWIGILSAILYLTFPVIFLWNESDPIYFLLLIFSIISSLETFFIFLVIKLDKTEVIYENNYSENIDFNNFSIEHAKPSFSLKKATIVSLASLFLSPPLAIIILSPLIFSSGNQGSTGIGESILILLLIGLILAACTSIIVFIFTEKNRVLNFVVAYLLNILIPSLVFGLFLLSIASLHAFTGL